MTNDQLTDNQQLLRLPPPRKKVLPPSDKAPSESVLNRAKVQTRRLYCRTIRSNSDCDSHNFKLINSAVSQKRRHTMVTFQASNPPTNMQEVREIFGVALENEFRNQYQAMRTLSFAPTEMKSADELMSKVEQTDTTFKLSTPKPYSWKNVAPPYYSSNKVRSDIVVDFSTRSSK